MVNMSCVSGSFTGVYRRTFQPLAATDPADAAIVKGSIAALLTSVEGGEREEVGCE